MSDAHDGLRGSQEPMHPELTAWQRAIEAHIGRWLEARGLTWERELDVALSAAETGLPSETTVVFTIGAERELRLYRDELVLRCGEEESDVLAPDEWVAADSGAGFDAPGDRVFDASEVSESLELWWRLGRPPG